MGEMELRTAWEEWAARAFGGDAQKVSAATEAALRALKGGASAAEAVQHAQAAVTAAPITTIPSPSRRPFQGPCGMVSGLLRTVQRDSNTQGTIAVWTFRVKPHDTGNGETTLIPVTLRGASLQGSLADGDLVLVNEAAARKKHGDMTLLCNYTTGGAVTRGPIWKAQATATDRQVQLPSVSGVVCNWVSYSESFSTGPRDRGMKISGWSFRIKVADATSKTAVLVPVDMRSEGEMKGILRNGDDVEIPEPWRSGQTLNPRLVLNRTTDTQIRVNNAQRRLGAYKIASTATTLLFGAVATVFTSILFHSPLVLPALLILLCLHIYMIWR